jgi:hypothetical protein
VAIGEYRGSKASIFLIVCGIALLLAGVFFAAVTPALSGAQSDASGIFAEVLVGVLFIAGALYAFWTVFSWRGAHAQLFERGFVISRAGKTVAARWEDIASVTQYVVRMRYYGIPVWTSHKYTVTLNNGDSLLINNGFSKVGKLGEAVQRMSANVLLPRAVAAYNSGAVLTFGKLSVSQAGISNGQETLPWSDLNQLTFNNGSVIITRKGKRMRWTATQIRKTPNVYVLMGLVSYVQRGIR